MRDGQFSQVPSSKSRQGDENAAPIVLGRMALGQPGFLQSVHQTYGALCRDLKLLRQLSHSYVIASGKTFDPQQRLILLRRQRVSPGGLLAEMQKLPHLVAEGG